MSDSWSMFPNMVHSSPATFHKERELLEVECHMLSAFQRVWILAVSTGPAVSGVKELQSAEFP